MDNILLTNEDTPLIMDFGSVTEARVTINSRKDALKLQEWAQQNMTPSYTAPEFFDCPSKCKIDERTDVWALGLCVVLFLYFVVFLHFAHSQFLVCSKCCILHGICFKCLYVCMVVCMYVC